jgi:peptidyl-prolyl cis-trans isomerase C
MKIRGILLLLIPAACLMAQKTLPLKGSDGKPVIGPDGKPATVTLNVEETPTGGPALSSLPPDKVILTIGDEKITAAQFEHMIQILPEQVRAMALGSGRRQFADNIVRVKVLAQQARKDKRDQTAAFKDQLAFQADNLLAGQLFQEMVKNMPVTEQAAKAYYEQHKSELERIHARHILIRFKGSPVPVKPDQKDITEEEALAKAKEIREKILAGADFAALAKAESDDTGSGAAGGDLGFFGHGQMVPSFEQAAFALPVGQVSEPVRSQFGYHIIKVEGAKTFEDLRPDIEQRMRPELAQKAVEDMRKSTAAVLDPAFFPEEKKPAPAPAAPAPQPKPEEKKQ